MCCREQVDLPSVQAWHVTPWMCADSPGRHVSCSEKEDEQAQAPQAPQARPPQEQVDPKRRPLYAPQREAPFRLPHSSRPSAVLAWEFKNLNAVLVNQCLATHSARWGSSSMLPECDVVTQILTPKSKRRIRDPLVFAECFSERVQ